MSPASPSMRKLLGFLRSYSVEHGIMPSTEEMRAHLGLCSKSGIVRLLNGMESRGMIRRLRQRARAIELVGGNEREALAERLARRLTETNRTHMAFDEALAFFRAELP